MDHEERKKAERRSLRWKDKQITPAKARRIRQALADGVAMDHLARAYGTDPTSLKKMIAEAEKTDRVMCERA